jgi:hypothetical protein
VIAPTLVMTVDGERVTVDVGQDEPVTVSRSDGMGHNAVADTQLLSACGLYGDRAGVI